MHEFWHESNSGRAVQSDSIKLACSIKAVHSRYPLKSCSGYLRWRENEPDQPAELTNFVIQYANRTDMNRSSDVFAYASHTYDMHIDLRTQKSNSKLEADLTKSVVLSDIAAFLVPAALVIGISACFGFEVHIGGLLVLVLLLCLLTAIVSAWSLSLGLILKQVSSLAAVVTGLQLPLTLLSGVLLPLSMGPQWLQNIAYINPMYYTVEASRVLATGIINSSETLTAFIVMIPLTVVVLAWATRVYQKAVA